ncbi:MAG: hypothetical protein DHS20C12_11940 [Pseudohongiella sp.]|nr:MAG: hypothetical protein DHS20C12_11940 [Pseudohongiella sp.]
MSNFTDVRNAIKAKIESVADVGTIQPRERFSKNNKELKAFYTTEIGDTGEYKLIGGFLRRVTYAGQSANDIYFTRKQAWEFHYLLGWDDENNSEEEFNEKIDAIAEAFETDTTLGNVTATVSSDGTPPLDLVQSGPAMFGGVLVHYAVMKINTVFLYDGT